MAAPRHPLSCPDITIPERNNMLKEENISEGSSDWFCSGYFFNQIQFLPWSDFQDTVHEEWKFCQTLSSQAYKKVEIYKEQINQDIDSNAHFDPSNFASIVRSALSAAGVIIAHHRDAAPGGFTVRFDQTLSTEVLLARTSARKRIDHPLNLQQHYALYSDDDKTDIPLGTIEIAYPLSPIVPNNTLRQNTIQEVVSFFQKQFDKNVIAMNIFERQLQKMDVLPPEVHSILLLSRAITKALHSRTGHSMLTTYNQTIFLRIERISNGVSQRCECQRNLKVFVSRVYKPDCEAGMIAASVSGIRQMKNSFLNFRHIDVDLKVREYINLMAEITKHQQKDAAWTTSIRKSLLPYSYNRRVFTSTSSKAKKTCPRYLKRKVLSELARNSRYNSWKVLIGEFMKSSSGGDDLFWNTIRNDEKITEAFNNRYSLVQTGHSHLVMTTVASGKAGWLKYWTQFGRDKSKLKDILNEFMLYRVLHEANLTGVAVAPLLAIGIHHWVGPCLVLQRAGESVRTGHGRLSIGGKLLTYPEVRELQKAAIRSLSKLHLAGITLVSISLENLRVEQIRTEPRSALLDQIEDNPAFCFIEVPLMWKVMWINLENGCLQKDPEQWEKEVDRCKGIFMPFLSSC